MKIDKDSLKEVFTTIIEDDFTPINACMVYNSTTGEFTIQSALTPMNDNEHIIERVDINPSGVGAFLCDTTTDDVDHLVDSMTVDEIVEYFLGGLKEGKDE